MVRPTRSIVVTGSPISAALPEMQSAEKEISFSLILEQVTTCTIQGSGAVANAWAFAKVAGRGEQASRILPDVDARLVGNLVARGPAPESGVFR
jgi:hypothetical protein